MWGEHYDDTLLYSGSFLKEFKIFVRKCILKKMSGFSIQEFKSHIIAQIYIS